MQVLDNLEKIIRSVKTWLGFFALVVLILYLILLAKAQITENVSILLVGLLGLSIVFVFVLSLKKALQEEAIRINVAFPLPIEEVNRLEFKESVLKIRDDKGTRTYMPNLTQGFGQAMTFLLTENIGHNGSLSLEITEPSGRKWKAQPFNPYTTTINMHIVEERPL